MASSAAMHLTVVLIALLGFFVFDVHASAFDASPASSGSAEISSVAYSAASQSRRRRLGPTAIPQAELDALYTIYNALGGANWHWKDPATFGAKWSVPAKTTAQSWASMNVDVCTWQGIECTCETHKHPAHLRTFDGADKNFYYSDDTPAQPSLPTCNINKLQLVELGVQGIFPASAIASLSQLIVLQITASDVDHKANVGLTGDLSDPQTEQALKGKLQLLKKLHLSQNRLGGKIGEWITGLPKLQSLWLDSNAINNLPQNLGLLSNLLSLRLSNNKIAFFDKGIIQGGPGYAGLQKLVYFDISYNDIAGDKGPLLVQLLSLSHIKYIYMGFNFPKGSVHTVMPDPAVDLPKKMLPESLLHLMLPTLGLAGTFPVAVLRNNHLASIDLSYNDQLAGELPQEICHATTNGDSGKLTYLDLSGNPLFTGTIPNEISNCANLMHLNLQSAGFSGILPPASFGKLTSLKYLDLGHNKFTGLLPPDLNLCSSLNYFDASNNTLTGGLSPSLGELTTLEVFDVNSNSLGGQLPPELSQLTQLSALRVNHNNLVGTLPTEYASLVNLLEFWAGDNKLEGPIPDEYRAWTALQTFDVGQNKKDDKNNIVTPQPRMAPGAGAGGATVIGLPVMRTSGITGTIPAFLGTLKNLQQLLLGDNLLSSSIPDLSGASKLENLHVFNNLLTGKLPLVITHTNLRILQANDNQLSGKLPADALVNSKSLTLVHLSNNKFTGSLPLGLPPTLQTLSVEKNLLVGTIPSDFAQLRDIVTLGLSQNQLKGAPFPPIKGGGGCQQLKVLAVDQNNLDGTIDSSIVNLVSLETFAINNNLVRGSLPAGMGSKLNKLQNLFLHYNKLTGSLQPLAESADQQLQVLSAIGNKFTSLPADNSWANWKQMTHIDVSRNLLSGSLPETVSQLTSLQELHIGTNSFNSKLPQGLGALHLLEVFIAANNSFTGPLPEVLGDLTALREIDLGHNSLSGKIPFVVQHADQTVHGVLASAKSLISLALNDNKFTGPIVLPVQSQGIEKDAHSLQNLLLGHNSLSGSIPREIGVMTDLRFLGLAYNHISGKVPPEIGALENLVHLELEDNNLTGPLPNLFCPIDNRKSYVDITGNSGIKCIGDCWLSNSNAVVMRDPGLQACPLSPDCPKGRMLPANQMIALKELWLATKGPGDGAGGAGWRWKEDKTAYGVEWNFEMSDDFSCYLHNPCSEMWQGVDCSCAPDPNQKSVHETSPGENFYYDDKSDSTNTMSTLCFVEKLELINMNLRGPLPVVSLEELDGMTHMQMANNQIEGSIPDSIGQITTLRLLNFANNQLSGVLPVSLTALSNLEILLLHTNRLVGPLTSQIGNLAALQVLKLHDNGFASLVPPQITALTNLRVLFLGGNKLTGDLPFTAANIKGLAKLEQIDVSNNLFAGKAVLDVICQLPRLQALNINTNYFAGPLPQLPATKFPQLKVLNIGYNKFTGPFVISYAQPPRLEELYVNECALSGQVPPLTSASKVLRVLDISNNQNVTGDLPTVLAPLFQAQVQMPSNLEIINLGGNNLRGSIPSFLGLFTKLTDIRLNSNALVGEVPSTLTNNLANLKVLWLDDNKLTGALSQGQVGGSVKLKGLRLNKNRFSGSISASYFANAKGIEEIDLSLNAFTGSLPPTLFSGLTSLLTFDASHNQLVGSIPSLTLLVRLQNLAMTSNSLTGNVPDLSSLTELVNLDLSNNMLSGSPPKMPSPTGKLETLFLSNNKLVGELPSSIYALTDLRKIAFDRNSLSCSDLSSLGKLVNLETINMNRNKITAQLPDSVDQLRHVKMMDFSVNGIEGTLPGNLAKMENLEELYLYSNRVTGPVPSELGDLRKLRVIDINSNSLSGELPFITLRKLDKLRTFRAHDNAFTGLIHPGVGDMLSLQELNLGQNKISGVIPHSVGRLTALISFVLADNDIHGTVPDVWGDTYTIKNLYLNNNTHLGGRLEKMFCDWLPTTKSEGISVDIRSTNITCFSSCWAQLLLPDPTKKRDASTDHLYHTSNQQICVGQPTKQPSGSPPNPAPSPVSPSHPTSQLQYPPGHLNPDEIRALKAMFDSMDGLNWRWGSGKSRTDTGAGIPWNFFPIDPASNLAKQYPGVMILQHDPCQEHWDGVECDCHPFPNDAHAQGFYYDDDSHRNSPASTVNGKCSVSKLQLIAHGLRGPIPDAVWAFGFLTHAQLSDNAISGSLPAALKNWRSIEKLHLSRNRLTGTLNGDILSSLLHLEQLWVDTNNLGGSLPDQLGALTNLRLFRAADNKLVGGLPLSLAKLVNLEELTLDTNDLSGPIPEAVLGKMRSLRTIALAVNRFTGFLPKNLNTLVRLETLMLQRNKLRGDVPDDLFADGSSLRAIDLSDNNLDGTIAASITKLGKLETLALSRNKNLGGTLPEDLGTGLSSCAFLLLDDTNIGGTLPASFDAFSTLQTLALSGTAIDCKSKPLPSGLSKNRNLKILGLAGLGFDDVLPDAWSKLTKLEMLDVSSNHIRGNIPVSYKSMTGLLELHIDDNNMDGSIDPAIFSSMPRLQRLLLSSNGFTNLGDLTKCPELIEVSCHSCKLEELDVNTIITEAGINLQIINLGSNLLTGTLPAIVAKMTDLVMLDISNNGIGGSLDSDLIGGLKKLTNLQVYHNAFTGQLPQIRHPELVFFDASQNHFSGELPEFPMVLPNLQVFRVAMNQITSLCSFIVRNDKDKTTALALPVLRQLALGNNRFSGQFPPALTQLTTLEILDFSSNSIGGKIPSDISKLGRLKQLTLDSNQLTGTLPSGIATLTDMETLYLFGNHLTGNLPADFFYDRTSARGLQKAIRIDISVNSFTNDAQATALDVGKLSKIESLLMNDNMFSLLPRNLGALKTLRQLHIHNNVIVDVLPSDLANMVSLEELVMGTMRLPSKQRISGKLPEAMGNMRNLAVLRSPNTIIGGGIPQSIIQCSSLVELDLTNNRLTGSARLYELSHNQKLKLINMAGNQLNDIIPTDVSQLRELQVLQYSGNRKMHGKLPDALGSLGALETLGLAGNQFDGTIPASLNQLTLLNILALDGNQFTGAVPGLFCGTKLSVAVNVTANPNLRCFSDCLSTEKLFVRDALLPSCSSTPAVPSATPGRAPSPAPIPGKPTAPSAPTIAPTYTPPTPWVQPKLSGSLQAKIVLFLASTDYVAILGHEAPYQIVIVEAVQRVVANAALTQQDFLGMLFEDDEADSLTDDESKASVTDDTKTNTATSLRARGRAHRSLTGVTRVAFYVNSNNPTLTFANVRKALNDAAKSGSLDKQIRAIANISPKLTPAMQSSTVVKIEVVNVGGSSGGGGGGGGGSSSSKSSSNANTSSEGFSMGEIVGAIVAVLAILVLIFAGFVYRERLCPATDKSSVVMETQMQSFTPASSSSSSRGSFTGGSPPSSAGRRDSIPMSNDGPALPENPSIAQVYKSDNPMHDGHEP